MLKTKNLDIADLAFHIADIRHEVTEAASAYKANPTSYDLARIDQYLALLQERHDNLSPAPDRPAWHRRDHFIDIPDVRSDYEGDNKFFNNFLRKLDATYFELCHSQSGDMSGDLQEFDKVRFQQGLDELKQEVESMRNVSPVDMPENYTINK